MKFSENWLRSLADPGCDRATLMHRLTMAGLEVEGVETLGDGLTGVVHDDEIADYAGRGDPVIGRLIDEAARAIAAGVGTVVNLLSPEVVVIGGGLTQALGPSFPERIWEVAQRYALPRAAENVRCVMAALGDDAGITGSAAYARNRFHAGGERA